MRIIRGKLKSRRIGVPKNFPSRPTTDYAKEGLFNILESKLQIEDSNVLDLCSGTGNIAIEFISRNAQTVTCIDNNYFCIKHIKKISTDFGIDNQLNAFKNDILNYLNKSNSKYNIVFCDPPYDLKIHEEVHKLVFEKELLVEDGILIIEHGKYTNLKNLEHFQFERPFGNVIFSFFQI